MLDLVRGRMLVAGVLYIQGRSPLVMARALEHVSADTSDITCGKTGHDGSH